MIQLSKKWIDKIIPQGETGMGYHIATITLKNGGKYNQVVIDSGYITRVRGLSEIPFTENDIEEIIVTHDKWNFRNE